MDSERDSFHAHVEHWQSRATRHGARRAGQASEALDDEVDDQARELGRPGLRSERMRSLSVWLGLDDIETDFVWWIVAAAIDPAIARDTQRPRRGASLAGFAELAGLDADRARDLAIRFATGHPLVSSGLIRALDEELGAAAGFVPASRLLAYLLGDDTIEAPVERTQIAVDERARYLFDRDQLQVIAQLAELAAPGARIVVALEGASRSGRRTAVAFGTYRTVLSLDFDRIPTSAIGPALRTLRRELVLADAVPVLANLSIDRSAPEALTAIARFIEDERGPVVITGSLALPSLPIDRPIVRLRWRVPGVDVRGALWRGALERDLGPAIDEIAMRYRLGPGEIHRAVGSARAMRPRALADSIGSAELIAGVRHNIDEGMAGLATRVEVTQTWDDAVLPEDTRDQVHGLVARLRHAHLVLERWGYRAKLARGTGVAALFSGPPGTGKTMCAGLIARELDLELYQVDLSQVVSKWVGETEKQLAKVFDGAEAGHALLLFDEADALFGQRSTETKGAVDRYANLEVNFLLQRIESFGGITILTTNLDTAIDKALKRRLAAHIVFATPDEEERAALWARLTHTASAPLAADLDFEELAHEFAAMTGANIRNSAIAGAFYAARDGATKIEQKHLVRAGRAEYRSMGHVLAERGRH
jgi:hypothetical protein